jgi:hypothetical protein
VYSDIELDPLILPPEKIRHDRKMCGTADGEKFCKALNDSEDDCLPDGHEFLG